MKTEIENRGEKERRDRKKCETKNEKERKEYREVDNIV